jgi:hypothetical protein
MRRWADEFSPDPRHRDGLQARCKECQAATLARYREERSVVIRATKARHRAKVRAAREPSAHESRQGAGDLRVLVEMVAGADAVVAVGDDEGHAEPEVAAHQQDG